MTTAVLASTAPSNPSHVDETSGEGVPLDSMLISLFGVDFLPFHEDIHGVSVKIKTSEERRLRKGETSSTVASSLTVSDRGLDLTVSDRGLDNKEQQSHPDEPTGSDVIVHSPPRTEPTIPEEKQETKPLVNAISVPPPPPPPLPPLNTSREIEEEESSVISSASQLTTTTNSGKKKRSKMKRAMHKIKKRTVGGTKSWKNDNSDDASVSSTLTTGATPTARELNIVTTTTSSSSQTSDKQGQDALQTIRSDFVQIEKHKAKLEAIQSEAKEASSRASQISTNIFNLSSTANDLHVKLQLLEQNLVKEQEELNAIVEKMKVLETQETKEEDEIKRLKGVIDFRTEHLSQLVSKSSIDASYHSAHESTEDEQNLMSPVSDISSIKDEDDDHQANMDAMKTLLLPKLPLSPVGDGDEDDEDLLFNDKDREIQLAPPTIPEIIEEEDEGQDREEKGSLKDEAQPSKHARPPLQERSSSSFMRTHDLEIEGGNIMALDGDNAPLLIEALTKMGIKYATDEGSMWTPTSDTKKYVDKREGEVAMSWLPHPWYQPHNKKEIFVWSGKFDHGGHGSDLPAIKTRGIIKCSSRSLVDLIVDSKRVKEYNGMSLGRTDDFIFQEGVDTDPCDSPLGIGGAAKLIRSKSKPPLIKKPIELFNIMHARKLDEEKGEKMGGYVISTRAVWEKEEYADALAKGGKKSGLPSDTTRNELLLGVNIVRDLDGEFEGWCEITAISHLNSPGIPLSLGKRIGLSAATNNIKSLQSIWG